MENNENQTEKNIDVTPPKSEEVKGNKFLQMLKKRKHFIAPVILLLALLITILYYNVKISNLETSFSEEKKEYKEMFAEKMDSLMLDNAYDVSWIFSWSVRSEMLRDNKEQVGLLMNQFVKTANVSSVSMINPKGIIELSTDKKLEGNTYSDLSKLSNPAKKVENDLLILPITGLNETIGHLEIRFQNLTTAVDK